MPSWSESICRRMWIPGADRRRRGRSAPGDLVRTHKTPSLVTADGGGHGDIGDAKVSAAGAWQVAGVRRTPQAPGRAAHDPPGAGRARHRGSPGKARADA